jgi:hypothetical protein
MMMLFRRLEHQHHDIMQMEQRAEILLKDKAYFSQSNDALVRCARRRESRTLPPCLVLSWCYPSAVFHPPVPCCCGFGIRRVAVQCQSCA